jgi:hypothetical protein
VETTAPEAIDASTQTIDVEAQPSAVEETRPEDTPAQATTQEETQAATQTIDVQAQPSE